MHVCTVVQKIAVGMLAELRAFAPQGTAEIHFKEGVLLPGFIDSHSHRLDGQ